MTRYRGRQLDKTSGRTRAISRRLALKLGAGCALVPLGLPRLATSSPKCPECDELPRLDGDVLVDDAARGSVATDFGHAVRRMPLAVVKPRTVDDLVRVLADASTRGIKVAMRGQAHSLYGQSLVGDGVVIDSSTLNHVGDATDETLDAQAGALWGDVAKAALAHGRLPPVMPDALMLSVGGTLGVGGMGEAGFRFGAQVDHVRELDIVTGAGEFITCSAARNAELFSMTLAGLGQCGIIVRARIELMTAASFVATHTLAYAELDAFLADQAVLTGNAAVDLLNGRLSRDQQGRREFLLTAGKLVATADEAALQPDWMSGLHYIKALPPVTVPIWNYLDRRTASVTASKARGIPNPSLIVTLPAKAAGPFVSEVLGSPELSVGIWFFEISPKVPARHTRPLQKMPAGALAYELRMQRRASATGASDHLAMLAANERLVANALDQGGKVYPPFAPVLSRAQWERHYERATWKRLAAAKRRYDPNNVLTPGVGIF